MIYFLVALALAAPVLAQTGSGTTAVPVSLKRAVEVALSPQDGNARVQLAQEMIRQAESRAAQSRAALLPDFAGYLTDQNQTRNLAAMGIRVQVPIPGFQFPTFVGPFTTLDARATMTTNLFDFSAIRRYQASRTAVRAVEAESDSTRDQVAAQVAKAYMAALRSDAQVEAAQANVDLAEALLKLAENQKTAGTGTGIEVTRARTQLADQRQTLLVARNEQTRAHLNLLRAMNMQMDATVSLTDRLEYTPPEPVTVEQALKTAWATRADWKAQQRREDNARLSYGAVKMERLPSVVGFADYGTIGTGFDNTLPTRTYGVSLRVPIFDGGRRDARRAESASQMRAESVRGRDLRGQIELEVRTALDSLHSAEEQVQVAEEGLKLAGDELAQAQRRYRAGVANGLEVTDAQTRMERARANRISALFQFNQARIDLAQSMGTIQQILK